MKKLYPSFQIIFPLSNGKELSKDELQNLHHKIFERDNFTCQYCGYKARSWQIVHRINGDLRDNREGNLEAICQMCNLIINIGFGCVTTGIVHLYKKSGYDQNRIIQITRDMRNEGEPDSKIIKKLGLALKCKYKMNRAYLSYLFGFVTSKTDERVHIKENK